MGVLDERFPDRGTIADIRPWYRTIGHMARVSGVGVGGVAEDEVRESCGTL